MPWVIVLDQSLCCLPTKWYLCGYLQLYPFMPSLEGVGGFWCLARVISMGNPVHLGGTRVWAVLSDAVNYMKLSSVYSDSICKN